MIGRMILDLQMLAAERHAEESRRIQAKNKADFQKWMLDERLSLEREIAQTYNCRRGKDEQIPK